MAEVLLAFGGNVGDVRDSFDRAEAMLSADGAVHLLARSSDYRTPPWGIAEQPHFVNRCIIVETRLAPLALLDRIQDIERALGRDRSRERRWGPRPLDIDILAYDELVLATPRLSLPHPRLFERAFVLVPLAEIAGERRIAGRRPREALAALDTSGIERLPPRR